MSFNFMADAPSAVILETQKINLSLFPHFHQLFANELIRTNLMENVSFTEC